MARFAVSGTATIAGTATLPLVSLYATAAVRPRLLEVGVFNTTAVSVPRVALVRLTTTGTQGAGLTEVPEDSTLHPAVATAFAGHTVAPTIGGELRSAPLGAAIGSGVIWTFSEAGIEIPEATTNGVGLIVASGTGQICTYYMHWAE